LSTLWNKRSFKRQTRPDRGAAHPDLVILDEPCYLPFSVSGGALLGQFSLEIRLKSQRKSTPKEFHFYP
jgi:hypothetical protein